MEVVLFRIHSSEDVDQVAYGEAFKRMHQLLQTVPRFLNIEAYTGEDDSQLALATFDSGDAIAAWRNNPEHVETQERGRREIFADHAITPASVSQQYRWPSTDQSDAPET